MEPEYKFPSFIPQKFQAKAISMMAPSQEVQFNGFGGPKFSGVTWTINYMAIMHSLAGPVKILIVDRDWPLLETFYKENLDTYLVKTGFADYSSLKRQFSVKRHAATIKLKAIASDEDARSLSGQAWDIILIDNAQYQSPYTLSYLQGINKVSNHQYTWRKTVMEKLEAARSANNQNDINRIEQIISDTFYHAKMMYGFCFAPDRKGSIWLKQKFWDGCCHELDPYTRTENFDRDEQTGNWIENPSDYQFCFAPMAGNKIGMEECPEYLKAINKVEEPYRTAYLTGDPTAFIN